MAARENQGLQIALIIFVILTIVLIVATYFTFTSYAEERDKAKSLAEAKSSSDTAAQRAIADAEEMTLLVSGDPKETLEGVKEAARNEMQVHGEGLVESKQNYRDLIKTMAAKMRELENENAKLSDDTAKLTAQLKTNEEAAQAEVAKYVAKLTETAGDLEAERKKFGEDRSEVTTQMSQLTDKFKATEAERDRTVEQSKGQIASLSTNLQQTEQLLVRLRDKDAADAKANEYPDGKVTRVNQRTRLVWLDVGPADGLRNQTSFVIVAPEDGNPIKSEPKGIIQVVRLTDDHQAEARIVEDDLSNPIMPGDNIFSTVWDAGRRDHFALVGKMDIDEDGEDDRKLIQNLISLNGGVVDAAIAVDGTKTGQMTIDTKYLVRGKRPDAESSEADVRAYSEMLGEAQKLGVKEMDVDEFLKYMGYKGQERTVNLGKFAKPSDFKPRLPENVQRTIKGNQLPTDVRKTRTNTDRETPK